MIRIMISKTYYFHLNIIMEIKSQINLILRKPKYNSKVFCIGYNKTGTTTIGKSLEMLGYRNSSFNKKVWRKYYKNNQIVKILRYTAKFESLDDLPWLKEDMIPVLDKVFPNSKFIYLIRDEESWQKSLYNWTYKKTGNYPNLEKKLQDFREHKKFVLNYFKNKPANQFIILDVRDEKGFTKLADFLGKKTSVEKFPHYNKTELSPNK